MLIKKYIDGEQIMNSLIRVLLTGFTGVLDQLHTLRHTMTENSLKVLAIMVLIALDRFIH
jgi:hypothetical protein